MFEIRHGVRGMTLPPETHIFTDDNIQQDKHEKPPQLFISEKRIREFCGRCDKQTHDNMCLQLSGYTQGINALNEICVWASIDGIKGKMTGEGFIPGRIHKHSNTENSKHLKLIRWGLAINIVDK